MVSQCLYINTIITFTLTSLVIYANLFSSFFSSLFYCSSERSSMISISELENQMKVLRAKLHGEIKTIHHKNEIKLRELAELNANSRRSLENKCSEMKKKLKVSENKTKELNNQVIALKSNANAHAKETLELQSQLQSSKKDFNEMNKEHLKDVAEMSHATEKLKKRIVALETSLEDQKNGANASNLEEEEERNRLTQKIEDLELLLEQEKKQNEKAGAGSEENRLKIEGMQRDFKDVQRKWKDAKDEIERLNEKNSKLKIELENNAKIKTSNINIEFGNEEAGLIARGMSTLLLYGATNQAELVKMFKRFDTDGNGNIDVDEWKNGFNELKDSGAFGKQSELINDKVGCKNAKPPVIDPPMFVLSAILTLLKRLVSTLCLSL